MRRYIFFVFVFCVWFATASFGFAQGIIFSKTLHRGSSGPEVTQLQELLKTLPDVYPEGTISGYFGRLTEKAVKKFQEKYGVEPVGIVGPKTRLKLNSLTKIKATTDTVLKAPKTATPPSVMSSKVGQAPKIEPQRIEIPQSAPFDTELKELEREIAVLLSDGRLIAPEHYARIRSRLDIMLSAGVNKERVQKLLVMIEKVNPHTVVSAPASQPSVAQSPSSVSSPESQRAQPAPLRIAESQAWVPDVLTQPVPKGASQTRLVLPAPINRILLKTLGTFGAHQGAHIEGLDHEWIGIKNDAPIGSWGDGIVTELKPNRDIWTLRINFGDGLFGEYMEIKTPLVKVGDTVKARQSIGYGKTLQRDPEYQSGEFVLGDAHRQDGIRSWVTNGVAVSPFDYLEDAAKQELIGAFTKEVIEPYIAKGQTIETITPWEPYLTNPVFLHKNHKGTLVGEWLLSNKKWREKDPASYEIITFLKPASTKYYPRQHAMGISSDIATDRLITYFGGDVDIDYAKKNFTIYTNDGVLRGIFELDESGPRAKFKTEYKLRGDFPESFSDNALIYTERQPFGIRDDAFQLGMIEKIY